MFKVPDTENVFGLLVFMNVSGFFFFLQGNAEGYENIGHFQRSIPYGSRRGPFPCVLYNSLDI